MVGVTIQVVDAYTVEFSIPVRDEDPVVTTYTTRGGNVFGVSTPAADFLRRLGLDQPEIAPNTRIVPLQNSNGIATIHRPAPDILVVQLNYGGPRIYGRCP